jgi:NhaP-type Na+/H+ or K+/H+ antiporter
MAAITTNQALFGLGLVIVIAIGCRLVANWLRIPAIVLLLPAGFIAGAATDYVQPDILLGPIYQPFVSLAVGLILFEAGLRLRFDELEEGVRGVVERLIAVGVVITWGCVGLAVGLLFGLGFGVSAVIGAILIVSGPTVVLPLLAFIRPVARVRSTLKWEGVLIDPIGALCGVVAFTFVNTSEASAGYQPGELLISLVVGGAVGAAAAGVLWLLLEASQRSAPQQAIPIALMMVAAAVVTADLLRDDAGLVATVVMGMILANQDRLDVSSVLEFHGTLVGVLIGILFVLISASVSPDQVADVLLGSLALVAIMVLLVRPAVVALATWRSPLSTNERGFLAAMDPRGIVAAATASSFGLQLQEAGIAGANKILPIVFIVIFSTVLLYGLGGVALARRLGVAGKGAVTVLVVGGHAWARAIAEALKRAGMNVHLWTGHPEEQEAARRSEMSVGHGQLSVDPATREEALENVNYVLLMTESDDFNALAAHELRRELGRNRVFRVAPAPGAIELVPIYAEGGILFNEDLTFAELEGRFQAGARIGEIPAGGDGATPLFVVTAEGDLRVIRSGEDGVAGPGEILIGLSDAVPR